MGNHFYFNDVGLDAINKLEEIIIHHELTIDDEEF